MVWRCAEDVVGISQGNKYPDCPRPCTQPTYLSMYVELMYARREYVKSLKPAENQNIAVLCPDS